MYYFNPTANKEGKKALLYPNPGNQEIGTALLYPNPIAINIKDGLSTTISKSYFQ